jgi:hypothetical protein
MSKNEAIKILQNVSSMAPLSWLKRGSGVGKTKRSKGTKPMAVVDGAGFPVALSVGSASLHEVRLVEKTFENRLMNERPERLVEDRAYDSDLWMRN